LYLGLSIMCIEHCIKWLLYANLHDTLDVKVKRQQSICKFKSCECCKLFEVSSKS
jgi:hypothetical protein